ncbi:AI-2E family transporter [Chrysiogenes arsenatis]|uniref:AI-2E family transporter n=1 Tax=Chrysiogenes arsenatis TaxID=309797 RepID=UPI00040F02BA|nr:AI-2E family transporter [Chrysiogenes arsenatis]
MDTLITLQLRLRHIIIALGVVGVFLLAWQVQDILTTFGIAFVIAYLLNPLVDKLERRGAGRTLVITLLFCSGFLISGAILYWLVPILTAEAASLARNLPRYAEIAFNLLQHHLTTLGVDLSLEDVRRMAIEKAASLSSYSATFIGSVATSVGAIGVWTLNLLLIPILVFYFLRDFNSIMEKSLRFVQNKYQWDGGKYFESFNTILSRYFRGQIIVSMILMAAYSVVLLIVGVKPAFLLGIIAGALSVVPYLGLAVGLGVSLLLAFLQFEGLFHLLAVLIGFSVVQVIETNVITPRIIGESLGLHPAMVIFALMAGGALMGIGGMILALPVAAFLRVLWMEWASSVPE